MELPALYEVATNGLSAGKEGGPPALRRTRYPEGEGLPVARLYETVIDVLSTFVNERVVGWLVGGTANVNEFPVRGEFIR